MKYLAAYLLLRLKDNKDVTEKQLQDFLKKIEVENDQN